MGSKENDVGKWVGYGFIRNGKKLHGLFLDLGLSWEDSWILSLLNDYFSNQSTSTLFNCLIPPSLPHYNKS